jgi:hypothetical protein
MMRALLAPAVVSSILLAPLAYGNTLQPGPPGSAPSDKSFTLTFSSADVRSSYVVDAKGFYEQGSWLKSSNMQVGAFGANDGTGDKGFSPTNGSADTFNSKSGNGGAGGSFAAVAGFLSSSGGGIGSAGMSSGGVGSFGFKGPGQAFDFQAGTKGLAGILVDSRPLDFDPGAHGAGLRDPSGSVSATPLPASWTMMLIGLLAFGCLACFRKLKTSTTRRHTAALAAE